MTSYGANLGAAAGNEAHHVKEEFMKAFNSQGDLDNQQSPTSAPQQPNKQSQPSRIGQTNRSDQSNFMRFQEANHQAMNGGGGLNNSDRQKSLSLEYGKTIRLLRNGDEFYRGRKFVINSRKYRYFDVFMDDISDVLNSNFGAIRKIHTPVNGHRVKTLDDLEDGKTYVAAGNGRFIKLNYGDISEGKRIPPNRLPALTRQDLNNYQVPQYDKTQNAVIYVYRNGDVMTPPYKILLYKSTMMSYDAVLNEITSKVQLLTGAVQKLYTMDGELVQSPAQLIHGNAYVAANKEKFKRVEYYPPENFSLSPRMLTRKSNSQPTSTTTSLKNNTNNTISGYSSGTKYTGWHKENSTQSNNVLPPVVGPKTKNPNLNKLNVDKDESGMYKARNLHYDSNAKTIDDSHDMFVDMPVDFKKANRVIHEEINEERQKKMSIPPNELMKPNSKPPPQQPQSQPQPQKPPEPALHHQEPKHPIHVENLDEKNSLKKFRKDVSTQTQLVNSNTERNLMINRKLESIFSDANYEKLNNNSSEISSGETKLESIREDETMSSDAKTSEFETQNEELKHLIHVIIESAIKKADSIEPFESVVHDNDSSIRIENEFELGASQEVVEKEKRNEKIELEASSGLKNNNNNNSSSNDNREIQEDSERKILNQTSNCMTLIRNEEFLESKSSKNELFEKCDTERVDVKLERSFVVKEIEQTENEEEEEEEEEDEKEEEVEENLIEGSDSLAKNNANEINTNNNKANCSVFSRSTTDTTLNKEETIEIVNSSILGNSSDDDDILSEYFKVNAKALKFITVKLAAKKPIINQPKKESIIPDAKSLNNSNEVKHQEPQQQQHDTSSNGMTDLQAAIKIQSFYRGFKTRSELKKRASENSE